MSMLDYVKLILEKVSFDRRLFEKELQKGIKQLVPGEVKQLKDWCYTRFGSVYRNILNRIFNRPQFA